MPHFSIKQGDTLPSIPGQLIGPLGVAQDLTGASVRFIMRKADRSRPQVAGTAVIVIAASGSVRYDWGATDTRDAGDYIAEWQATLPGGGILTFPNDKSLHVRVEPQVGS